MEFPALFRSGKRLPLLMGIVNATPDSFSGGFCKSEAAERGFRLLDEGADWLDLGGESTRPGAGEVDSGEETARILPILAAWRAQRPDALVSVDTRKADVAEAALAAGAGWINDVSMLAYSRGELARAVAQAGAGLILCHSRGTPETKETVYADVVAEVCRELSGALELALKYGVKREKILIDPGIGFGKSTAENWQLLGAIPALAAVGPVLIGHSRKRFLQTACGEVPPLEREAAGLGVSLALARRGGVSVLRVHEIKPLADALAAERRVYGELRWN